MKPKLMTPEGRAAALRVPAQADYRRYNAGGYPDRRPTTSNFAAPFSRGAPPPGGQGPSFRAPSGIPGRPQRPEGQGPGAFGGSAGGPRLPPTFRPPQQRPEVVSSGPPGVGVNRPPATPTHGGAWSSSSSDSQHTRAGHYGQRTDYTGEGLWQSTRRPDVNPPRPTLDVIDPGDGVVSSPGVAGRRPAVLDEIQRANMARSQAPVAPVQQEDLLGTYAKQVLAPTAPSGQAPSGWASSSTGLEGDAAGEEQAQTWTEEEVREGSSPHDVVERAKNRWVNSRPDGWTEEQWLNHLRDVYGLSGDVLVAKYMEALGMASATAAENGLPYEEYTEDEVARAIANGWYLADNPETGMFEWRRVDAAGPHGDDYNGPSVDTGPGGRSAVIGALTGQPPVGDDDEFDLDALFEEGRSELDAIDARANVARERAIEAAQRERALQLSRALRVANMIGASNNMPAEAVFGSMAEMGRATGLSGATEDARTRLEGEFQSAQREWDFWRQRVEIANAQQNRNAAEASARYALAAQERLMRLQDSLSTPTAGEAALGIFGSLLSAAGTGAGYALGAKI